MKLGDHAAFAKSAFYHAEGGIDPPQEGMSLRHYFAGQALMGFISSGADVFSGDNGQILSVASLSVHYADALLAELAKPEQP